MIPRERASVPSVSNGSTLHVPHARMLAMRRGTRRLHGGGRGAAVAAVAAVAALLVAGCAGNDERSSGDPASAAQPADGEGLYQANCASCHGADLRGTPKGPSHLSVVYEPNHHGDDAFRSAIANGSPQHHWTFGDMPPVEGLSSSEVDAVIAYVRDVQEREGFE